MRRVFLAVLLAASAGLTVSCGGTTQLYAWGKRARTGYGTCSSYEADVYDYYRTRTPEAAVRLVGTYEYMILHPGGKRGVVPPGICAEYGFFLLQDDTLDALCAVTARKKGIILPRERYYEKGLAMLEMEMRLYPESRTLIEPVLERARKR